MYGFSYFPDFKVDEKVAMVVHCKTYPEIIIAGHHGDIYHPDNGIGRTNLFEISRLKPLSILILSILTFNSRMYDL